MSTEIKIKASDGHSFDAWQSEARGEKKGSVVVLHAITGRISHLADVCDQWADNGYTAIAPSLFDRISPNIINSYDPDGVKAGIGHYTSLTEKQILTDIAASSEKLKRNQPVVISGFCTGGTWAWVSAAKLHFDAMVKLASLTRIGSKIKINIERVRDRIPSDLIKQLSEDPRGTVMDYKMTDGRGIGLVLKLKDGSQNWFFEDEVS